MDHCLEGAHLVLEALSKKQIKASKLHLKVIRSSIALVLSLMFRIGSMSQDNGELDQRLTLMKKTVVEAIHEFVNKWIKRVVGSVFGGGVPFWDKTTVLSRLNKETKVCSNIYYLEACVHLLILYVQLWQDLLELSCPASVEQDWHGLVDTIITKRVKDLAPGDRVDMLCELEDGSHASSSCTLITNIFITESITALEEVVFSQVKLVTGVSVYC